MNVKKEYTFRTYELETLAKAIDCYRVRITKAQEELGSAALGHECDIRMVEHLSEKLHKALEA